MGTESNMTMVAVLGLMCVMLGMAIGGVAFMYSLVRQVLGRYEDRFSRFSEFQQQASHGRAVVTAKITAIEETLRALANKSEEHGANIVLMLPRLAVLEEAERLEHRQPT